MRVPGHSDIEDSLESFLKSVRPRLKTLFVRYHIPPQDTEDILQQTLLAFVDHRESLRDPEAWLIGTLRRNCLLYWRDHRRKIYEAVDATVLDWLSEPQAPDQESVDRGGGEALGLRPVASEPASWGLNLYDEAIDRVFRMILSREADAAGERSAPR